MVGMLLVLMGWAQTAPSTRTSEPVLLHARVYPVGGVDRSTVERAQGVARRLVASAGIDLVWRLCDLPHACVPSTRPLGEIAIVLSAEKLPERNEQCGRALNGPRAGEGYVRVSEPCVTPAVQRFLISRGWPLLPQLMRETLDDVLGAVVAHELGHLLGLKHGRGVMDARLDSNDIHAIRLGSLVFSASQAARMRTLLAERTREDLAGGRRP
jgi:hypothetical protein